MDKPPDYEYIDDPPPPAYFTVVPPHPSSGYQVYTIPSNFQYEIPLEPLESAQSEELMQLEVILSRCHKIFLERSEKDKLVVNFKFSDEENNLLFEGNCPKALYKCRSVANTPQTWKIIDAESSQIIISGRPIQALHIDTGCISSAFPKETIFHSGSTFIGSVATQFLSNEFYILPKERRNHFVILPDPTRLSLWCSGSKSFHIINTDNYPLFGRIKESDSKNRKLCIDFPVGATTNEKALILGASMILYRFSYPNSCGFNCCTKRPILFIIFAIVIITILLIFIAPLLFYMFGS